ncbi:unnamed protein product [Rodentolepis nana]|uniref:Uncharacterized protein n=1 Tax=Rodentolepis nana TaxID=102285 RepID=A0A3P7TVT7_RODNA|nr:unnamed protein product [Rodentolepis nana]
MRRRVEENSSRLPTEYGDVTAPPSGHPSSPSKDLPSSKRGGRKGNRRFDRNYGGYEAETANLLIGITRSESKLADDQSPSDLGSLQSSQSSEASLITSISS